MDPNESHGRWQPLPIEEVTEIFARAPFRWWISGGHALELHVGDQWREHDDLDVGICRHDASQARTWLDDWDLWVAAAGELSPWDGRPLDAEREENNVWARREPDHPWAFDLTLNECTDQRWVYRRDPFITRQWQSAVLDGPLGVPYLAPELQLLFKSSQLRSKDHGDARRVIPALENERRIWLSNHLSPDHPWQTTIKEAFHSH